jgi:catechol 2,3-dioxygenase-like lactoylglutathione lyase family enzyme
MRWLTVRVPGQDREILLERPGPPGYDPATAENVREMVTKGASGGTLFFNTDDAHAAHAELKAKGVELGEEPTRQSYGIDFGFRDPFGNNIRIAQRFAPEDQS